MIARRVGHEKIVIGEVHAHESYVLHSMTTERSSVAWSFDVLL